MCGKRKGKSNMADAKTEKQKVKEITDKLEEGLKELFESGEGVCQVKCVSFLKILLLFTVNVS